MVEIPELSGPNSEANKDPSKVHITTIPIKSDKDVVGGVVLGAIDQLDINTEQFNNAIDTGVTAALKFRPIVPRLGLVASLATQFRQDVTTGATGYLAARTMATRPLMQLVSKQDATIRTESDRRAAVNALILERTINARMREVTAGQANQLASSQNLLHFHTSVSSNYMRQSLALNYRQLFNTHSLVTLTKAFADMAENKLDAIKINTKLPDSKKIGIVGRLIEATKKEAFSQIGKFALSRATSIVSDHVAPAVASYLGSDVRPDLHLKERAAGLAGRGADRMRSNRFGKSILNSAEAPVKSITSTLTPFINRIQTHVTDFTNKHNLAERLQPDLLWQKSKSPRNKISNLLRSLSKTGAAKSQPTSETLAHQTSSAAATEGSHAPPSAIENLLHQPSTEWYRTSSTLARKDIDELVTTHLVKIYTLLNQRLPAPDRANSFATHNKGLHSGSQGAGLSGGLGQFGANDRHGSSGGGEHSGGLLDSVEQAAEIAVGSRLLRAGKGGLRLLGRGLRAGKGAIAAAVGLGGASLAAKTAEAGIEAAASPLASAAAKGAESVIAKTAVSAAEKAAVNGTGKLLIREGGKAILKSIAKKIPFLGLVAGGIFAAKRAMAGDWTGAAMELASGAASTVPGIGTAGSVALDTALAARDVMGSSNTTEADSAVTTPTAPGTPPSPIKTTTGFLSRWYSPKRKRVVPTSTTQSNTTTTPDSTAADTQTTVTTAEPSTAAMAPFQRSPTGILPVESVTPTVDNFNNYNNQATSSYTSTAPVLHTPAGSAAAMSTANPAAHVANTARITFNSQARAPGAPNVSNDNKPSAPITGNNFEQKASGVMQNLMQDFALTKEQAAGIVGNIGHETGGMRSMQEVNPVGGGRGGLGWCQWTGPRRVQFEKYCNDNNLDVNSDEANYGYLKQELSTTYKASIAAVKQTSDASSAMQAFEKHYERAGVKNYASRERYANIAMANFDGSPASVGNSPSDTTAPETTAPGAPSGNRPSNIVTASFSSGGPAAGNLPTGVVGTGQCVDLVKKSTGLGQTATWQSGGSIVGNPNLKPGMAIATMDPNGNYGNHTDGSSHAAIYLGPSTKYPGGIRVYDQWAGHPASEREIMPTGKSAVNSANAYSIIKTAANPSGVVAEPFKTGTTETASTTPTTDTVAPSTNVASNDTTTTTASSDLTSIMPPASQTNNSLSIGPGSTPSLLSNDEATSSGNTGGGLVGPIRNVIAPVQSAVLAAQTSQQQLSTPATTPQIPAIGQPQAGTHPELLANGRSTVALMQRMLDMNTSIHATLKDLHQTTKDGIDADQQNATTAAPTVIAPQINQVSIPDRKDSDADGLNISKKRDNRYAA